MLDILIIANSHIKKPNWIQLFCVLNKSKVGGDLLNKQWKAAPLVSGNFRVVNDIKKRVTHKKA